ncbi:hypothetical protein OG897_27275 [Streptomyces sp. NBC_00237]|uniref:hypothetical protein n=1 Tax=Streptomyces sp. NBC_00237 TaxID=2975687 RepID=UPI00224D9BA8|nr:hypothetical protein [Streptomyces sp. NBC_00237]MCX5205145.1 hypothetical protein [Streptomyces sp. NBC_00237]
MTRSRMTLLSAVALLAALAPLTPLGPLGGKSATAAEAPRQEPLTVRDPGFELGGSAWQFTPGTGTATNNPHSGKRLAYLDAGSGRKVSQTVTATGRGAYVVSAWIATGGPGGKYVLRINGTVVVSQALPAAANYRRHTLGSVDLSPGDRLEIAFESGDGWVNADDVMVSPAAPARPKVTSSDPRVAEMFAWATKKANSWVHLPGTEGPLNADERQTGGTGSALYGPSYWAGYANRSGYYSRDMAHQLAGAGVLGLHAENKAMLRAFAASATPEHRYYPVWALNFDNRTPLSIDYRNPGLFVREVPAVFELVQKAEEAYRWSGDRAYLDDPALWDFYRHATEEFVTLHDGQKDNGPRAEVAEGTGKGIFQGVASYNEQSDEPLAESGDAIGSQYRAYRAVASLARAKGDKKTAARFDRKARDLKSYFNTAWSGGGSGADMVRGYTTDGRALTGWGKENSWFMPMKGIVAPGERREAYLDYIDAQSSGPDRPTNIEALTYLPDTFFANDRPDTAWKWMQHVYAQKDVQHVNTRQGTNGDYPEVSFSLVGQTVEGLMGVAPNAPARTLTTHSGLPSGMQWLAVEDLRVGDSAFTLRHDTARRSTLTHTTGATPYTWEARFRGTHRTLKVDGMVKPARTEVIDGVTYSSVRTRVAPGRTVTVEVR